MRKRGKDFFIESSDKFNLQLIVILALLLIVVIVILNGEKMPITGMAVKSPMKVVYQCSDGKDNDLDGKCDFNGCIKGRGKTRQELPKDPDCLNSTIDSEKCFPSPEVCDGKDNNCDGTIDENVCKSDYYCDSDSDGVIGNDIDGSCFSYNCVPKTCSINPRNDCNDNDPKINPFVVESCDNDQINNDCDSEIDECTCFNSIKDGLETDIDCGGVCNGCDLYLKCQKNSDCNLGSCIAGACSLPVNCNELFPGTNDASKDRVNVVFVGLAYYNKSLFLDDAQKSIDYYSNLSSPRQGLLELNAYKNSKSKFNFWYIDTIFPANTDSYGGCTNSESYNYCSGLSNTIRINLCSNSFRSYAYFGGESYVSSYDKSAWPYVVLHEFQHQFPRLADEYIEATQGDRPSFPNCAVDLSTAQSYWGDLEGQNGSDGLSIGYNDGCSYILGNYRPTVTSMMRVNGEMRLGLVNERQINSVLSQFTGSPSTVTGNAIEVTLAGEPTNIDSYKVIEYKEINYKNKVKSITKKPYKLKIQLSTKSFSENFDTYDHLVIEELSNKKMSGEFLLIPLRTVKVIVPLENSKYDSLAKKIKMNNELYDFSFTLEKN